MSEVTPQKSKKPFLWDFTFVAILPVICFVLDPIFVQWPEPARYALYLLVVTLVAAFWLSFISTENSFLKNLFNGAILLGLAVATAIGVLLLPMTVVGLFVIVGALGLVPFGTALRFKRRFLANGGRWPENAIHASVMLLGLALPTILPIVAYQLISAHLDPRINAVTQQDVTLAKNALQDLGDTWFCQESCANEISGLYSQSKIAIPEPEFRKTFFKVFGKEYDASDFLD
jgi:hypothetical protein